MNRNRATRGNRRRNKVTGMTLEQYQNKLKENMSLLVSLGGSLIAFCLYNVAVYQQLEIEVFGHTTDLIQLDQVTKNILAFKIYIEIFVLCIPIYLAIHTFFSPVETRVMVASPKFITLWVFPITYVATMGYLVTFVWGIREQWIGLESSYGSVGALSVFVATHILGIINILFKKRSGSGNTVMIDMKIITAMSVSLVLLIGMSFPYWTSLNSIQKEKEINYVEYKKKTYYLVEKNQDKLLLREIKRPKSTYSREDEECRLIESYYVPTQRYIVVDARGIVITNKEMLKPVKKKLSKIEFEDTRVKVICTKKKIKG